MDLILDIGKPVMLVCEIKLKVFNGGIWHSDYLDQGRPVCLSVFVVCTSLVPLLRSEGAFM